MLETHPIIESRGFCPQRAILDSRMALTTGALIVVFNWMRFGIGGFL
jgi:hypothetical protein